MTTSFRVKTGCLTCRQRRKKCDEREPVCTGCTRNFLECDWPSPVTFRDGNRKPKRSPSGANSPPHLKTPKLETGRARTQHTVVVLDCSRQAAAKKKPAKPLQTAIDDTSGDNTTADGVPDGSMIIWRGITSSFMSDDRPILLTRHSFLLLQHYMEDTACFLVPKVRTRNPFITHVLPLAYSDDLLMHAVMALSGTHLSYQQNDNLDIQLATRNHYSLLLRGLRLAFAEEARQPCTERSLRLLVILVVLCHVEVSSSLAQPLTHLCIPVLTW